MNLTFSIVKNIIKHMSVHNTLCSKKTSNLGNNKWHREIKAYPYNKQGNQFYLWKNDAHTSAITIHQGANK